MRRAAAVTVMLVTLPGCSFLFMRGAPSGAGGDRWVTCDEGYAYPVIDTLIAIAAVSAAVGAGTEGGSSDGAAPAITFGVETAAFGGSAYYGYRARSRCTRAHEEFAEHRREAPAMPPGAGLEGHDCMPGNGCLTGLICASGLCVRPPGGAPSAPGGAPSAPGGAL